MDRIQEMLDRIGELSDQELTELEGLVLAEFETLEKEELSQASADGMEKLAGHLDTVRGELATRSQAAAELAQRAEAAKTRVRGSEPAAEEGAPEEAPEGAELAPAGGDAEDNGPGGDGGADEASEPHAFVDADGDGMCDVCGKAADDPIHNVTAAAAAEPAEPATPAEPAPAATPAEPAAVTADAGETPAEPAAESAEPAPTEEPAPSAESPPQGEEPAAAAEGEAAPPAEEAPASEAPTETGKEESEEPVTASATPGGEEPVVTAPADRQPIPRAQAPVAITAGADIPGYAPGATLDDMGAVAEAMTKRIHQMTRTAGGDGEQATVASLVASFPEDRVLKANDPEGNTEKIRSVTSPEAITAAGGICAPVDVRYELFGLGELGRPAKDAIPSFTADRGGIRYITPPTLTDLDGAASLWTLQDDIDAATAGAPDPVKPCLRVACGTEVTVYTDAIPLCLTFGNLNARAYPELVARHNELALISHARFAETRLLTRVGSLSTAVTTTRKIGATADFLASVDRAATAYRNRHRMGDTASLRVMAPLWLKDLMRADMAYRMPGDGVDENLGIADARIAAFFTSRNVNISWFMDGETGQVFSAQNAGSLLDFPDNVIWYIFAEGTFLFLDGGTLDLGLVRDSTLNGTNDYKMFVEVFEGVAKVGIESLRVTSRLEPTGMAAGTVDLTAGVAA